ncbi:MAG: hypothetical protein AB1593_08025 [Pseudomonadota bacterium]
MLFLLVQLTALQAWAEVQIYYEPGINPYREQMSQDGVTSVDPYSGTLKVQHVDLLLPGNGGLDIKVMRVYDSARVVQIGVGGGLLSPIGNGWIFHFGSISGYDVCNPTTGNYAMRPTVNLQDGSQFRLYKAPSGFGHLYTSKEGWVADCANAATGEGLVVTSPEGVRYEMTVKGVLGLVVGENVFYVKKVTDKHGNWLSFDYQVTNNKAYVKRVTSNDGRTVDFLYNAAGGLSGERLTKVSANGKNWQYEYALSGTPVPPTDNASSFELAAVTRPDGMRWRYEYPTFNLVPLTVERGYLGKLTYPEGGTEEYTYTTVSSGTPIAAKFVRVTQKVAYDTINPEAVWTYRYKFWESAGSASVGVSVTDVTDPAGGVTTYKHETPYNAYNSSLVQPWRIGLLLDKLTCSSNNGAVLTCTPQLALRREQTEWGSQVVSPDPYKGYTGLEVYTQSQTYRPLVTKRTITQDGVSYVTQYQSHDSYGNPGRTVETGNGTTRTTDITYYNDPVKWITGLRDRETIDGTWIVDRTFDASGNMLSESRYGVQTTFTYHASGDLASRTDANGNRTDFSDYYRGVPRREDQPGGVTILRAVNPTGTLASETNGEGHRTDYAYDSLNRLAEIAPPTGNRTVIMWLKNSAVSCEGIHYSGCAYDRDMQRKLVTRGTFEESTLFDGFGRAVDVTKRDTSNSARVRRAYRYDALGRKQMEAYPTTSTNSIAYATGQMWLPGIQYTHDPLGRLTKLTHADGKTRQLQYLTGNKIKITNENGKATTYSYRSFGDPDQRELMSVTAPVAAANLTLARNVLGQITSMAQSGVTRTLQYDSRGYLVKANHPEIGWVSYERDAVGNPLSKSVGTAPNVRTINYDYDSRNRLVGTSYADGATPSVVLAYNSVDDIVSATRGGVERRYDYDANRNLIGEFLIVDGRTFALGYQYDGNDAVAQALYPDGQTVDFYPDALGRPTAVSPYVTNVAYHPSGQVSSMSYANGVTATQTFNTRLWPEKTTVKNAAAANLLNTTNKYDGLGNLTSIADTVDTGLNRTLKYDAIDRLTSATGPWGAGTLTYDGRGNLLTQNYGATYSRTYTYDASNRLASYTGSTAFAYDAWGNAIRSGTALSNHTFDDASNLVCASCDTASPMLFEYDANNYRVKKTRNGVVTYSLYAKDGNLMMEYSPSSGDLKQFAYHNKKQVAMRHVVNPAMILGHVGPQHANRLAGKGQFGSEPVRLDYSFGLIVDTPLLAVALMAEPY